MNRLLRLREELDLRPWASASHLTWDSTEFEQKWRDAGQIEGAEHQVYPEAGRWRKRTDLIFHGTWLEYFHRLVLHNWLFPDTAYTFDGFMDVEGKFHAVVWQKSVRATGGASRTKVEQEMTMMGFKRIGGDDYYNPSLGVLVEDLHDENAVITPRQSLVIFDPIIYLAKPEMDLA